MESNIRSVEWYIRKISESLYRENFKMEAAQNKLKRSTSCSDVLQESSRTMLEDQEFLEMNV